MKSIKLTCAVLGLSLASLTPLMAETSLRVNVPYPFVAGKVKLPAGVYTIQEEEVNGVVTIRDSAGKAVVVLSGPGMQTASGARPSLIFVNVGGEMVLSTIQGAENPSRVLPTHGAVQ